MTGQVPVFELKASVLLKDADGRVCKVQPVQVPVMEKDFNKTLQEIAEEMIEGVLARG